MVKFEFWTSDNKGGCSAGIFESPFGSLHISSKSKSTIACVSMHSNLITVHAIPLPEGLYIDYNGSLWIDEPSDFSPVLIATLKDGKLVPVEHSLCEPKGGDARKD